MMKTLLHLRKAFGHSMKGLRETFRNEMAFRIELTAAVILIPTAIILSVSPIVRIMLVGSVFLVLIVELFNTGIETVVNRISAEQHHLSRNGKRCRKCRGFCCLFKPRFCLGYSFV